MYVYSIMYVYLIYLMCVYKCISLSNYYPSLSCKVVVIVARLSTYVELFLYIDTVGVLRPKMFADLCVCLSGGQEILTKKYKHIERLYSFSRFF